MTHSCQWLDRHQSSSDESLKHHASGPCPLSICLLTNGNNTSYAEVPASSFWKKGQSSSFGFRKFFLKPSKNFQKNFKNAKKCQKNLKKIELLEHSKSNFLKFTYDNIGIEWSTVSAGPVNPGSRFADGLADEFDTIPDRSLPNVVRLDPHVRALTH